MKLHIGKSALQIASQDDKRVRNNRRIFSTIVLKKKNTNEFNARLVVRGDTVSEEKRPSVAHRRLGGEAYPRFRFWRHFSVGMRRVSTLPNPSYMHLISNKTIDISSFYRHT